MRKLSLYLHFPFCLGKCTYCDFVSYPWGLHRDWKSYLTLLRKELLLKVQSFDLEGSFLESVYFGGGTPSLLPAFSIGDFLLYLQRFFKCSEKIEITVEVNPGTIDENWLKEAICSGVSRIQVGVQSFDRRFLRFARRVCRVEDTYAVLELLSEQDFQNWGADLIYGWPFQSFSEWQRDLEKLLNFNPFHISVYELSIHFPVPMAWFEKKHPRSFPSDDEKAKWLSWTRDWLTQKGYVHYEISNFAKPGFECRHNLRYWRNEEYLGLGVAAWSYLGGERHRNSKHLKNYRSRLENDSLPIEYRETLSLVRKLEEEMFLRLRTSEGVDVEVLSRKYPAVLVGEKVKRLEFLLREGFLQRKSSRYFLTPRGILVANQVFSEIID